MSRALTQEQIDLRIELLKQKEDYYDKMSDSCLNKVLETMDISYVGRADILKGMSQAIHFAITALEIDDESVEKMIEKIKNDKAKEKEV